MVERIILASSFGKDSTAMIHLMQEHQERIDEIMFFETSWDFPQMETHIQQVRKNTGIRIVRIRHYRHWDEMLGQSGWPHPFLPGGWCSSCKRSNCNKYIRHTKGTTECIGFTTDEIRRTKRSELQKKKWFVCFPLIEYGFSGSDTLSYCLSLGYDWSGLYDVLDRVSCFCCPKGGQKRIDKLKTNFPTLYDRYLEMDEIAKKSKKGYTLCKPLKRKAIRYKTL